MNQEIKKYMVTEGYVEEKDAISEVYKAISVVRFCAQNAPLGLSDILHDQCERLERAVEVLEQQEDRDCSRRKGES